MKLSSDYMLRFDREIYGFIMQGCGRCIGRAQCDEIGARVGTTAALFSQRNCFSELLVKTERDAADGLIEVRFLKRRHRAQI